MFRENHVLTPLLENGQSSKSLVRQISIFDALSVKRRCEMVKMKMCFLYEVRGLHSLWRVFIFSCYILIIKVTRCTISELYFGSELYMFRTDILSIIRSLNTLFTATGICHTNYVDVCYLSLADSQHVETSIWRRVQDCVEFYLYASYMPKWRGKQQLYIYLSNTHPN